MTIATRVLPPRPLSTLRGAERTITISSLIAMSLSFVIYLAHTFRPEQTYFIITHNSKNQVYPLDTPNVTSSALLNWATLATINSFTMDFYNIDKNLASLQGVFTIPGYRGYLRSMLDNGNIETIKREKLIVSAVAVKTPIIAFQGIHENVYTWFIQVPLLMTYQGASEKPSQEIKVITLRVQKVPTDFAVAGIGIAQLIEGKISPNA